MSFFSELKRRNVFRVGIAYAVAAWLLLQITEVLTELLQLPPDIGRTVVYVLAIGIVPALVFAWAFELTPDGLKREKDVKPETSVARGTGRRLDRIIIGMLVLVVAWFLVDEFHFEPREAERLAAESAEGEIAAIEKAAPDNASIAVLPFVNMSNDDENEFFSDGLTETLLHMLAQLPDLQVAARTSSFYYKNTDLPIGQIAGELNVAHVLEGSVQKANEQVRITAQLIRASDGFHMWSQSYTRPLEDIFAIQDEIATDVARALDDSLLGSSNFRVQGPATSNLDAYEAYLRALDAQSSFSYTSLETAERLFKQALVQDPDFLEARLGLVRNYLLMHMTGLIDRQETMGLINPQLAQVREQDDDNPQARAYDLVLRTEWPEVMSEMDLAQRQEALSEMRSLLATIPGEWLVRWRVAELVAIEEQDEQGALEVLQAGLLVDPQSAFLYARIGDRLRGLKRYEEAEAALNRSRELDPSQPGVYTRLAALALELNDLTGEFDWRRQAAEADPQDHEISAYLASRFYNLRLTEAGDQWLRKVAALVPDSDFTRQLAVARAESQEDWELVMQLSEAMIENQATEREGILHRVLSSYVFSAARLGKQEEAAAFIFSRQPGVEDYSQPPDSSIAMSLKMNALFLLPDIPGGQDPVAALEHMKVHGSAMGLDWTSNPFIRAVDATMRGDSKGAVPDALEMLSVPPAVFIQNPNEFELPFMRPLAMEPEVAVRLGELDRGVEQLREEVIAMLLRPEWQ